jgi:hypothetical protein
MLSHDLRTCGGMPRLHSEEHIMANIVVRDLTESLELDHEAMAAVIGGARMRGRPANLGHLLMQNTRIVDYPAGVKRTRSGDKPLSARGDAGKRK